MSDDIPPPPGPDMLCVALSPETWRAIITVMMEAPIPGRIVSPLVAQIAVALSENGHALP